MSVVPSEDQSTIREICALFTEAEHAIKGKRSQGTESFRDQAGLRMTYTPRHPVCENLRHPVTAYNMGFIEWYSFAP
jgi:hypothetical protein